MFLSDGVSGDGSKWLVTEVGCILEVVLVDIYCPFRGPSSGLLDPVGPCCLQDVGQCHRPPRRTHNTKGKRGEEREKGLSQGAVFSASSLVRIWFGSPRGSEVVCLGADSFLSSSICV